MAAIPLQKLKIDVPISVATEPEIRWLIDIPALADTDTCAYDGTIADPVTKTVFLRPLQFDPDFTPEPLDFKSGGPPPVPPTGWEEVTIARTGNVYMLSKAGNADTIQTAAQVPANTALVVSFYVYGSLGAKGNYKVATFGFGQYTLDVYADGRSALNKQSSVVGEGHLCGTGRNLTGRFARLLVLPFNRHDILFWCDVGGAWVYHDLSLDLANAENTITTAAKFTVSFPASKGLVQAQKAKYPATGTFGVNNRCLGYDPTDQTVNSKRSVILHKDAVSGTNVETAIEAAREEATNQIGVATTFTLTGDSEATPFLYAAEITWEGSRTPRQGASREVAHRSFVQGMDVDPELHSAGFVLDPMAGVANLGGWPTGGDMGGSVGAYDESGRELFLGTLGAPGLLGAQAPAAQMQASGLWKQLRMACFRCDFRVDGMKDSDVIELCLKLAGIEDERMSVSEGTELPKDPRGKLTLFGFRAGTTADVVAKQVADLWSNWVLTVRTVDGKQKVCYGPPDTSGTPVKTFYRSHLAKGWKHAYWSNLRTWKSAVAGGDIPWNIVVVRGKAIDGDYLYGRHPAYDDKNKAATPELAEAERPRNWFGAPVTKYYVDDRLCTQAAVDHVRDVLKDRHIEGKEYASWVADYDFEKVTVGSLVMLEGQGKYRITSIAPWYGSPAKPAGGAGTPMPAVQLGQHEDYQPMTYIGEKVET